MVVRSQQATKVEELLILARMKALYEQEHRLVRQIRDERAIKEEALRGPKEQEAEEEIKRRLMKTRSQKRAERRVPTALLYN